MLESNNKDRRNLWQGTWGYAESFIIGSGLILVGFCLELFNDQGSSISMAFPVNAIVLGGFLVVLILLQLFAGRSQFIMWLSGVPASISSIVIVGLLVVLMGVIPQVPTTDPLITKLKLNDILAHRAFLLSMLYFLTALGLVTIRRIRRASFKDLGFILNHMGLFIALAAGLLGDADMQRVSVDTYEGKYSWTGIDKTRQPVELPFAVFLEDFNMEEFPPKIALVDNETGEAIDKERGNLALIEKGGSYTIADYKITVDEFYQSSGRIGDRYAKVNEPGSPPSAYIEVRSNKVDDMMVAGWISCGSFSQSYQSLKVNERHSIVMTIPEPRHYQSDVKIISPEEEIDGVSLEVNKPYKYNGWKLYQAGYEERMGRWSNKSVLEVNRDPWLPLVYLGIFMMIGGAIQLIWKGNKSRIKNG